MALTEKQWTTLVGDLQRALARMVPEWTDHNTHDPGVTVLEALCYVLTDLQYRSVALDAHARGLARMLAERASMLAAPASSDVNDDDCGRGLQRVNYFAGKVLGAEDFNAEQDYLRARLKRRNRVLHGTGIATGLGVAVEHASTGSRITIAPGVALDPMGDEICIEQGIQLALPAQGAKLLVLLRYAERPCRMAPVVTDASVDASDEGMGMQPTRIVETFSATLSAAPAADAVAIARLRKMRGRWRVDPRFKAVRLGKR